ncbi:MAG TPA: iron ABC transporter substrate-binding protein [Gaiellaceae bacterium]|nr:iron ABC transporter substrate-binding protein [Gaiellaceae bacterium]
MGKEGLTRRTVALLAGAVAALTLPLVAGCGGEDADITVYSGRQEDLVEDLFEQFEEETGITVDVRYGDSAELAATIAEEGDNTPADVFFAQDAGSLGAVSGEGLLEELPAETLERVDERFRDPESRWVGTSGRVRVVVYNTDELSEDDLPDSIWDYADSEWQGRIGFAPTNASFQAMVTAMRLDRGDDETREWLEAIVANDPHLYENNIATVEAAAAGEVDVGFVNHYYLYGHLQENPDDPVANHHLEAGDSGALVNVAGAGILASTDKPGMAQQLVDYLLADTGQEYFATETDEYPLVDGIESDNDLPPLTDLHGPDVELGALGGELEATIELLNSVGLLS